MFSDHKRIKIAAFKNIFFIDDIRRTSFWPAKEFFYDLLREPATEVFGEAPQESLRQQIAKEREHPLFSPLFDVSSSDDSSWASGYEQIDATFAATLQEVIRSDVLVVGYELTPGLINFFDEKAIPWLDLRISPVRFLPDLLIAVRTSLPDVQNELSRYSICASEIRNNASQSIASARYRERYHRMDNHNGAVGSPITYIIGQTPHDASLVEGGQFIRLSDYKDQLVSLLHDKEVAYLPHPSAPTWHRAEDCAFLRQIIEKFSVSGIALYDAFSSEREAEFIGLSSGSLQEAAFFGRKTTMLHRSVCPLRYPDSNIHDTSAYWQIPFQIFSDPAFLKLLSGEKPNIEPIPLNRITNNALRKLHDVWWGYAEVAGRSNVLTDVQQRPLANQIRLLEQRLSQTVALFLATPDYMSERYINLYNRKYRWLDGAIVTFMPDGNVHRNGEPQGRWWELSSGSSKEIYLVWGDNGWIDKAIGNSGWMQLHCVNNIGHHFTVESVSS